MAALIPTLTLKDVTISYAQNRRWLDAVRNVSLQIEAGQSLGLVGESGSGKSTLALAIMGYLSANGRVRSGQIQLGNQDLATLSPAQMQTVRARQIKLVPQNALSALNPAMRIGAQMAESLTATAQVDPQGKANSQSRQVVNAQVADLLSMVRLADPQRVMAAYPHELSGGMQQRVMIAMALGARPDLLIMDEPTTALDVTTAATILDLIRDLMQAQRTAMLYVSHNLGVVAGICDRVAVLYAGELVEEAGVADLYHRPLHPYTQGLLASVPQVGQNRHTHQLQAIPGAIPHLNEVPAGCVFAPRCPLVVARCNTERPALDSPRAGHTVRCHRWPEILSGEIGQPNHKATGPSTPQPSTQLSKQPEPLLKIRGLSKRFPLPRSPLEWLRRRPVRQVRAVDDIDLHLNKGRTLGLVGESGSGKTTVARCVIGLTPRSDGEITLLNLPLAPRLAQRDRAVLQRLQIVFQNPDEALNPYMTVGQTLGRALRRLGGVAAHEVNRHVADLLAAVKLRPEYAQRLPGQLSGGEKQRAAIARAFAARPDLLIFDESVSALDVSVQASILNLLTELQTQAESAYLFITHDLGVVSYLADEIAVIYLGRLMEVGSTAAVLTPPFHPYTEALLSAVPTLDPNGQPHPIRLEGETPSPVETPKGCPFHTRCPRSLGRICQEETPPWQTQGDGHRIFCHIPLEELGQQVDSK